MDARWVTIESVTEEDMMRECWKSLPFEVPYEQFKKEILQLRRKHQQNRFISLSWYALETIWSWSGPLLSTMQYRDTIIALIFWLNR
jgi:hypothetical protein